MGLLGDIFGADVERRWNEATPDLPSRIKEVDAARDIAQRTQRDVQRRLQEEQRKAAERRRKREAERERKRREKEKRKRERKRERERKRREREKRKRERKRERERKRREKEKRERERKRREKEKRKRELQDPTQTFLYGLNRTGKAVLDVATGGKADEIRANFQQTEQYERSKENVENSDGLGKVGAVLEAGVDASLDAEGRSVQDAVAEAAGGRENIARTYGDVATAADDALDPVNLSTRRNRFVRGLGDFIVDPVAGGVTAVASGTDLQTGEKTDATAEDITEAALLPLAVPGRAVGVGARGARAAVNATAGGATRLNMVNPLRLLRGFTRTADEAADAVSGARRTVTSGASKADATSGTSRIFDRLRPGQAPRTVEQANSNRRSTGIDRLRSSEGGTGSGPTRRGNLPDRSNPRRLDTQFGGGADDAFVTLRQSADGVFRQADNAPVRSGNLPVRANNLPARAADAAESADDQIRAILATSDDAADVTRRTRRTPSGRQTPDDDVADAFRNFDRTGDGTRAATRTGDRAADATRTGDRAADAARATGLFGLFARRSDDAGGLLGGITRRSDEGGGIFSRIFRSSDDAGDAGRATRTGRRGDDVNNRRPREPDTPDNRRRPRDPDDPDAPRRGRDGPNSVPGTSRLGELWQNSKRMIYTTVGAGIIAGAFAGPGQDLVKPDTTISGDGWTAQWVKDYVVDSEGNTVYLYRVFEGGQPSGFTVVLGADESGRIYYLGGSPDRPMRGRSRVTISGLANAESRREARAAANWNFDIPSMGDVMPDTGAESNSSGGRSETSRTTGGGVA